MAGEGPTSFWPLFGLVVRTPRLELRLLREDEFADLVELIDGGIHDPGTMPFSFPWTDAEPRRARPGGRAVDVAPAGQLVAGQLDPHVRRVRGRDDSSACRTSEPSTSAPSAPSRPDRGSAGPTRDRVWAVRCGRRSCTWPSPASAREEALSGAFEDNAASLATSRAVGYEENGEARGHRRDGSGRTIRFRLGRDGWERRRRSDIEILGLEECLDMFVGPPG